MADPRMTTTAEADLLRMVEQRNELLTALTALVAHTTNGACLADASLAAAYKQAIEAMLLVDATEGSTHAG